MPVLNRLAGSGQADTQHTTEQQQNNEEDKARDMCQQYAVATGLGVIKRHTLR